MAGLSDLVGVLMQGGLTQSGNNRVGNALGQGGLGQSGGLLEQMLGGGAGGGGGGGGLMGGLMDAAKDMLGGQGQSSSGGNALATGGLGALAGALFGGGSGAAKGALGGGAMAMLAGLAFQAFKNMNQQPQGVQSFSSASPPLGLRAPANAQEEEQMESQASVIVRGMLNAAKADGQIDNEELEKIANRLKEANADQDTVKWVQDELNRPADLDGLVNDIPDQATAAQVYLASLFAIEVDTQAEINYLQQLAHRTGLDINMVRQLHAMVGIT